MLTSAFDNIIGVNLSSRNAPRLHLNSYRQNVLDINNRVQRSRHLINRCGEQLM